MEIGPFPSAVQEDLAEQLHAELRTFEVREAALTYSSKLANPSRQPQSIKGPQPADLQLPMVLSLTVRHQTAIKSLFWPA